MVLCIKPLTCWWLVYVYDWSPIVMSFRDLGEGIESIL